ncbi:hypothetical protein J1N35_015021 [Gossypium stocksii]|uniref:Uncharacterized protein n=1 Tax=Gossypium stocksii TaxID=47602 RepID=A0A9D3VW41_9ROSI|nr:hypothetical protein J1N35_015021 [Gossypium stocksii]
MVQSVEEAWPFRANGELTWALVRKLRKSVFFFCTICNNPSRHWLSSTLGFMGESSVKDLVENIVDLAIPPTSLTYLLPLAPLS